MIFVFCLREKQRKQTFPQKIRRKKKTSEICVLSPLSEFNYLVSNSEVGLKYTSFG